MCLIYLNEKSSVGRKANTRSFRYKHNVNRLWIETKRMICEYEKEYQEKKNSCFRILRKYIGATFFYSYFQTIDFNFEVINFDPKIINFNLEISDFDMSIN